MEANKARILLAEDDENLGMLLKEYMQVKGYEIDLYPNGEKAFSGFQKAKYDICILDVMMPVKDGITLAKEIRMLSSTVPILFLTAKSVKEDVLEGFAAGADDYMTKPFSLEELIARLRGMLRRSGAMTSRDDSRLVVGDLVMDEDAHEVTRGGDMIHLTATEFELLRYLMRNPRRVLSKAQILDRVWNYDFGGQANVVELYISYLRKKIDVGRAPMIHTLRGVGYVLKPAVE